MKWEQTKYLCKVKPKVDPSMDFNVDCYLEMRMGDMCVDTSTVGLSTFKENHHHIRMQVNWGTDPAKIVI